MKGARGMKNIICSKAVDISKAVIEDISIDSSKLRNTHQQPIWVK